ncbi:MAG: hypothetical protein JWQ04_1646 [Pedosphaera sp.]|nr:hypothetical protein [Pedosphaera sp.]
MNDPNQNQDPNLLTNAAPASAPQNETQLDQEIARTDALGVAARKYEAVLKSVRPDLPAPPTHAAPAPVPGTADISNADPKTKAVIEILTSLATDPFALIKRAVADAQRAPAEPNAPSAAGTPENPANSDPVMAADLNGTDNLARSFSPNQSKATALESPAPALPPGQPFSDPGPQPLDGVGREFTGAAGQQAQALQAAGERMSAALEQNTQLTVSLFNEMLALMDDQNRKLGEVNQKISELGSQIKSLKNP